MATTPTFNGAPTNAGVQIVAADTSDLKTLITAGTDLRVEVLAVTSDDTVDRVVQLTHTIGGTDFLIGAASIPQGSGTNGSPASLLDNATNNPALSVDNNGNVIIDLASGDLLKVNTTTTVTAAKAITVIMHAKARS